VIHRSRQFAPARQPDHQEDVIPVAVKVKLRNPDRIVDVEGPATVSALLGALEIVPEAVLVIRDSTLLTRDERLGPDDEVEVRPVLSGGSS
jgi:sulfur carrier protein ThiS